MKNKPKFNLMDGFLIILIVLIIGGVVAYLFLTSKNPEIPEGEPITATCTVELSGCKSDIVEGFAKALENGENVTVGRDKTFTAKITDVSYAPVRHMLESDGKEPVIITDDPIYYNIYVTFETQATESETEISAQGSILRVGEGKDVRTKNVSGSGVITRMDIR